MSSRGVEVRTLLSVALVSPVMAGAMALLVAGSSCGGPPEHTPEANNDGSATTQLEEMIRRVRAGEYENIHSVLVFHADSLVLEAYFDGHDAETPHEIRSATKVIGSMLSGIAIDKGFLPSEEVAVYRYFDREYRPAYGWTEQARSVRIRDLLSMTSGYDCDDLASPAFACEHAMYEAEDWVQYALDLPLVHERGTHWAYNSASLILVGETIARSAGVTLEQFAETNLFGPLGVESFEWASSPQGHAWVGGSARATPRDLLLIGRLMLERGLWKGRRILSEEWIAKSTRSQADYSAGVHYGFIWQIGEFFVGGEWIPAYWASGNGGQYIVVFPEHDMVAVFTGGNYDSPLAAQPFGMIDEYVLPAVLGISEPAVIEVAGKRLESLSGTYRLDFEPSVTSIIDTHRGALRILTPDQEHVPLRPHSATWFSGKSQYGLINVLFEDGASGRANVFTIYARGSRFRFSR